MFKNSCISLRDISSKIKTNKTVNVVRNFQAAGQPRELFKGSFPPLTSGQRNGKLISWTFQPSSGAFQWASREYLLLSDLTFRDVRIMHRSITKIYSPLRE